LDPFEDIIEAEIIESEFGGGGSRGGVGFDPADGQLAVSLGDGLACEPGTGEVDVELGDGIDVPFM
jgi:hypothetical protein